MSLSEKPQPRAILPVDVAAIRSQHQGAFVLVHFKRILRPRQKLGLNRDLVNEVDLDAGLQCELALPEGMA